jgi:membrane fusion protein (multidrug efflux system)
MAERVALVVSEGSVFQVQNRAYVYVVDVDHVARQRQIEIGGRDFGIVEVLSGLEEGELVVTEGIVKLRDGIPVRLAGRDPEVSERSDSRDTADAANARS